MSIRRPSLTHRCLYAVDEGRVDVYAANDTGCECNSWLSSICFHRYFCSPKAEVLRELDTKASQLDAEAKSLREQRDAIERKMKDTETQLRELLSQSPSLARRLGAVKIH